MTSCRLMTISVRFRLRGGAWAAAEIMLTFRRADFNVAKISGRKKKVLKLRFCDKKVRKIPFSTNDIYFLVTSKYALLLVL